MLALVKRNIKIYFRNKGAWLASLLTVFIIIGLYALFLGFVKEVIKMPDKAGKRGIRTLNPERGIAASRTAHDLYAT